jgi:hypothetical protein
VALASLSSQSIGFFLNSGLVMLCVLRRVAGASESPSQRHQSSTLINTDRGIDNSNANQYGLREARMKNNIEPLGSNY